MIEELERLIADRDAARAAYDRADIIINGVSIAAELYVARERLQAFWNANAPAILERLKAGSDLDKRNAGLHATHKDRIVQREAPSWAWTWIDHVLAADIASRNSTWAGVLQKDIEDAYKAMRPLTAYKGEGDE